MFPLCRRDQESKVQGGGFVIQKGDGSSLTVRVFLLGRLLRRGKKIAVFLLCD